MTYRRPAVSVIVCAYTERRWNDLLAAMISAADQTVMPREIILVVDHNPALLERAQRTFIDVAVVPNEEAPGLSGARNSGVRAARGEVLAFLDDDAVAAPDWLEHLLEPYRDADVVGVGGIVEPLWADARPHFMPSEFDWVVGCTYRGLPTTTAPVRNLIGASMSLRRDVFETVGGFRADVGRVGTRPAGCEETELCIRAVQGMPGSRMIFAPRSRVRHRVTEERAAWSYFRARCWAEGLSKAIVASAAGREDGLASERRYVTHTLPAGVAREIRAVVAHRDATGLARAAAIVAGLAITAAGYAAGALRARST
jgi:glucosyl-dolichyl phosphate glucuronosyltransferase